MQINWDIKHPRVSARNERRPCCMDMKSNWAVRHATWHWQAACADSCKQTRCVKTTKMLFVISLEDAGRTAVEGGGGINTIWLKDYKNCGEYERLHVMLDDRTKKEKKNFSFLFLARRVWLTVRRVFVVH